jgi:hypothetical protein
MAETVIGLSALHARFHALESADMTKGMMKKAAAYTRGQMIRNMAAMGARKTGATAASIQPRNITETTAELWGSRVLVYIDEGTGVEGPLHHRITPQAAKVMRWFGGPAGSLRLTGKPRKGAAGAGAGPIFATSTRGMAPRPYIKRSVDEAGKAIDTELGSVVVDTWNDAA